MELRLLELALRILDPRKWRLRMLQGAIGVAATVWIWVRAVNGSELQRELRDARRAERNQRIRARNIELERAQSSG